ncbi:MAG: hypothetical protein GX323_04875 [Clostridiales bacterium]|nr:hypothetical protein [Clostridiales bacterium]
MDYYYSKNKSRPGKNRPYYHNQRTPLDSYYSRNLANMDPKQDSLIIDENTVYEIDEECFKKLIDSKKTNKNRK